ncbi:lipid-A-disaccharide synthase [Coraliomargarita algicola]|uniref:Lipid-A-disaccharide synthase n=1 Tax=Coraliomargarita algicola TaxID=3092156 RepID=A0ABZ0RK23_9BACT|nr:lipid-A-disaccharide synthase [Coraliomargarita sp. J2-16]WPJ95428.1 lipid-A-disaccharide synthase [Coraliomargarita sp. J2-16]
MSNSLPATTDFPAPINGQPDLLIIAGEHSGDEHAAQLLTDLRRQQPELKVACLGGVELQAAGAQLLYDLTAVSIVGFVEVVRHYSFFKGLFDRTLEWIERYQPKHICFVDYPGFNLRLADQLAQRGLSCKGGGSIGLSYYIGPQVWAWKAKRRFKMADLIDRLGVIFPFEVDCFADTELPTEFVGHPFVREAWQAPFRYDASAPVLLLPGSRPAAVGRIFPLLLAGFRQARGSHPDLQATVVYPSEQIRAQLEAVLAAEPDLAAHIQLVANSQQSLPASAVLMSSGTMSLACALSAIPGAIAYRLNPMSYWIGRMLVKVKYIGIANLLLDRPLHPEFIQDAASASQLSRQLIRALEDPAAAEQAAAGAQELCELLHAGSDASAAVWLAQGLLES